MKPFTVYAATRQSPLAALQPTFDDATVAGPSPAAAGAVPPPSPVGPSAGAQTGSQNQTTPPLVAADTSAGSEGVLAGPLSNGSADPVPHDTGDSAAAPNATAVSQQKAVPAAPAAANPGMAAPLADSFIYGSEVETDKNGNPAQVTLPSQDTGGTTEIAGFTDKYDPQQLAQIASTPPAQRKDLVLSLIDQKTAPAAAWSDEPAVQGLLRDTVFHRGAGGAQAIIHAALTGQVPVGQDGKPLASYQLTPDEVQQIKVMHPLDAINAISKARQTYENSIYGVRPQLAKGLTNRFNNAQQHFTKLYLGDQS